MDSSVKNSKHFITKIKILELQQNDTLLNFNIITLFTNAPVNKTMPVLEEILEKDANLNEWSSLSVNAIVEFLGISTLKMTYSQGNDECCILTELHWPPHHFQ